jgi:hypothetical protein
MNPVSVGHFASTTATVKEELHAIACYTLITFIQSIANRQTNRATAFCRLLNKTGKVPLSLQRSRCRLYCRRHTNSSTRGHLRFPYVTGPGFEREAALCETAVSQSLRYVSGNREGTNSQLKRSTCPSTSSVLKLNVGSITVYRSVSITELSHPIICHAYLTHFNHIFELAGAGSSTIAVRIAV